jgi:hypothetical protein
MPHELANLVLHIDLVPLRHVVSCPTAQNASSAEVG